jgi:hypothetical protein
MGVPLNVTAAERDIVAFLIGEGCEIAVLRNANSTARTSERRGGHGQEIKGGFDMSNFLLMRIEDTKRAIARNERLMREYPAPSVEANLQSFRKVLRQLESELAGTPRPVPNMETSQPLPESNCIPPNAP